MHLLNVRNSENYSVDEQTTAKLKLWSSGQEISKIATTISTDALPALTDWYPIDVLTPASNVNYRGCGHRSNFSTPKGWTGREVSEIPVGKICLSRFWHLVHQSSGPDTQQLSSWQSWLQPVCMQWKWLCMRLHKLANSTRIKVDASDYKFATASL